MGLGFCYAVQVLSAKPAKPRFASRHLRLFSFDLLPCESEESLDFASVVRNARRHLERSLFENLAQGRDLVDRAPVRARLARQKSSALTNKLAKSLQRSRGWCDPPLSDARHGACVERRLRNGPLLHCEMETDP